MAGLVTGWKKYQISKNLTNKTTCIHPRVATSLLTLIILVGFETLVTLPEIAEAIQF